MNLHTETVAAFSPGHLAVVIFVMIDSVGVIFETFDWVGGGQWRGYLNWSTKILYVNDLVV